MSLYVSTSCLRDCQDLAHVLDLYSRAKIRNIELGSSHNYLQDVIGLLSRHRDTQFIVHNYFPPVREPFIMNLAAQDESIRSRSLEVCRAAIALCSFLGSPLYSFHPGFRVEGTLDRDFGLSGPVLPYEQAFKAFASSLEQILSYAIELKVEVAVENLEHRNDSYMMTRPEEFAGLNEIFPEVGVLLDLGHLKIASRRLGFRIEDFISCVFDHLAGIHLHDNDGVSDLHLEPMAGEMLEYLPRHSCSRMILECRNLSLERIVRNIRHLEGCCEESRCMDGAI